MRILIPPISCLHKQPLRFGSFSLGIIFFALDVYLTRRNAHKNTFSESSASNLPPSKQQLKNEKCHKLVSGKIATLAITTPLIISPSILLT